MEVQALSRSADGHPAALVSPVQSFLERVHAEQLGETGGEVATYIPELAGADPEAFAICLVTVDGAVYEVGDARTPFTIQSISKPLTYGLVLDDLGPDEVARHVGLEPTGDAFNGIALEPGTGRPQNPMVNAGAIAMSGLVRGGPGADPIDRLLDTYARYAGRALAVDAAVSRSEAATGHRNRAIAHLLRGAGMIGGDPERALDVYFDQCSVAVDVRDLATIAATLANGGVNPRSGERAASEETVRTVLSVMSSCGMYDWAGEWLCSVGLPAKSGVAGGILAVLPGQLGIGVFSPRLDPQGNSVRGIRVCQVLSQELRLHLVQSGRRPGPAIRSASTVAGRGSKRARSEAELAALAATGHRARVLELQGDVGFGAAEEVLRALADGDLAGGLVLLDLRRVSRLDPAVMPLLADLADGLARAGGRLVLSGARQHGPAVRALVDAIDGDGAAPALLEDLDEALEWCERRLLDDAGVASEPERVPLDRHELVHGLDPAGLARVRQLLTPRRFAAGSRIVRAGEPADELLLIVRGNVSVTLELPGAERRRLATRTAGMVVGELAVLGREARSADVWADTAVDCYALGEPGLALLGRTDPALKCQLLENLLRIVTRVARRMNDEVALLAA